MPCLLPDDSGSCTCALASLLEDATALAATLTTASFVRPTGDRPGNVMLWSRFERGSGAGLGIGETVLAATASGFIIAERRPGLETRFFDGRNSFRCPATLMDGEMLAAPPQVPSCGHRKHFTQWSPLDACRPLSTSSILVVDLETMLCGTPTGLLRSTDGGGQSDGGVTRACAGARRSRATDVCGHGPWRDGEPGWRIHLAVFASTANP